MTFFNFFEKLFKFFRAKYSFEKIKHSSIVFYDSTGSEIFFEFLKNKNYYILETRFKVINIRILILSILKYKLRWRINNYFDLYLRKLNPNYIITFIDNNLNFLKLKKKFKKTKIIFIQNGWRDDDLDIFAKLTKKDENSFIVDKMFVFNKGIGEQYKKYVKGEIIPIGSVINNNFKLNPSDDKSVAYISSFSNYDRRWKSFGYYTLREEANNRIFRLLSSYCSDKKIKLKVIARKQGSDGKEEKNFYMNINKNCIFIEKDNIKHNTYKILDESNLIINIDSTLGYESLARGKKTLFLHCRGYFLKENVPFGWPYNFKNEGFFWCNNFNKSKILKLVDRLYNLSQKKWDKISLNYKNKLMIYDYNNKLLKKFFRKIK